tara:strand:- start:9139 stop:10284 length:1146 start_codon:yes stop_codon:yes gene_type:complete
MKKNKSCDICASEMSHIWGLDNGIAPNYYCNTPSDDVTKRQDIFFCEGCQMLANIHNFSLEDLFGKYVYRTPNTSMDLEIVDFLSHFIQEQDLHDVVEVAGNNGVFAEKLLDKTNIDDLSYTIIDTVTLSTNHKQITHIDSFLEEGKRDLFSGLPPGLVIVRHALAHNVSIKKFFGDIVDILTPDYVYIENASLINTVHKQDYSQLYSEHFFQVSPSSIAAVGKLFGYAVLKLEQFEIHNGSFGIILHKATRGLELSPRQFTTDEVFGSVRNWADAVREFWLGLSHKGQKIVVWGCSAKFLFTYSALELGEICPVSYIIDSTPEKVGFYAPGTSVLVSHEKVIDDLGSDMLFVIGARNFENHIRSKILEACPDAQILCPPF